MIFFVLDLAGRRKDTGFCDSFFQSRMSINEASRDRKDLLGANLKLEFGLPVISRFDREFVKRHGKGTDVLYSS